MFITTNTERSQHETTYVLDDLVEDLDALATLIAFSALVETERKRSPLNWWLYASCAEAVARAAAKIRAEVLMLLTW